MLRTALLYDDGPIALRYPRGDAVGVELPAEPEPIEIGRGEMLAEGERVALLGYGTGVQHRARGGEAPARAGHRGDRLRRPVRQAARRASCCAVARRRARAARDRRGERARRRLRLGRARAPLRRRRYCASGPRVLRFGIPDRYVTHGKPDLLRQEIGLTPERIAERVEAALELPRHLARPEPRVPFQPRPLAIRWPYEEAGEPPGLDDRRDVALGSLDRRRRFLGPVTGRSPLFVTRTSGTRTPTCTSQISVAAHYQFDSGPGLVSRRASASRSIPIDTPPMKVLRSTSC